MHGAWEKKVDHNAPLYSRQTEVGDATYLNIDWAINYWLEKGVPKDKFVLGLATYGRVFTLADSSYLPGALNNGTGAIGKVNFINFYFYRLFRNRRKYFFFKFTREAGFLSYFEICDKLINKGWTRTWSNEQSVPYAYGENQWVGYDDVQSLAIKVIFAWAFLLERAL